MFRIDIQGLRAIAVIAVVLFHAFPKYITGGFIGVDIFFVISGYLITSIIIKEIRSGKFYIKNFYTRRIRRIFPALIFLIFICYLIAWVVLVPKAFREFGRTIISTTFFASNFDFWLLTDYFDGPADTKPLLHTWSLAVEEQFYIFFPPFLYFIWKKFPNKIFIILVSTLLLSLIGSEITRTISPRTAFFFTPSRVFELLVGSLLAIGLPIQLKNEKIRNFLSVLGLGLIVSTIIFYSKNTPFPGISALIPCLGTALLIYTGKEQQTIGGKIISNRPMVYIGNLSYSLYLWHWPILAFIRSYVGIDLTWPIATIAIIMALIISIISYNFIEKPFLKEKYSKFPFIKIALIIMVITSSMGSLAYFLNGIPQRFPLEIRAILDSANDISPYRDKCHNGRDRTITYEENCIFGSEKAPDTAIWADSHGAELAISLGDHARKLDRSVLQITSSACPPILDYDTSYRPNCKNHNNNTLASLSMDNRIKNVILIVNSQAYPNSVLFAGGFEKLISKLRAADKNVIIVGQIPNMTFDPAFQITKAYRRGDSLAQVGILKEDYDKNYLPWTSYQKELALRYNSKFYDPSSVLCDTKLCSAFSPKFGPIYFNGDHIGVKGSNIISNDLGKIIFN